MADKIQCKMSVYEESTVLKKNTVIALNLLILRKVIREAWTTLWKYHSILICGQKKIECWYLLGKKQSKKKRRWHYINPFSTAYYKSCVSLLPLKGNFERNYKIYTKKKQQEWPKKENDIDLRQTRDIRILYFGREMQKDVYDMEKLHWE